MIYMKLFLYPVAWNEYYVQSIKVYMKLNKKNIMFKLDFQPRLVVQSYLRYRQKSESKFKTRKTSNIATEYTSKTTCGHWVKKSILCKTKCRSRQSRHKEEKASRIPYVSITWKGRTAKTLSRKKPITAERPILQTPKFNRQPKNFHAPVKQKPTLPEISVKCVGHVHPVTKPTVNPGISETVPEHVKQVPGTEHKT